MVRLVLFFLLALPLHLAAQFPFDTTFTAILDSFDVRVNHPFGPRYKLLDAHENRYLNEQQRVYSRDEKLELRFFVFAEDSTEHFFGLPHVRAGHLLANLASNDEDAQTTVLSPDTEELEILNADWAKVYLFRPKRSFSEHKRAQLVASYKEGRGMLYTILLFDRLPEDLLGRQYALRWR